MKQATFGHRKFLRFVRLLRPLLGNCAASAKIVAAGTLTALWHRSYEAGHPLVGDADDVADAVDWGGDSGGIAQALERSGWLDLIDGEYWIHDLADHCPDYVIKKWFRQIASEGGTTEARASELLAAAGVARKILLRYYWASNCRVRSVADLKAAVRSAVAASVGDDQDGSPTSPESLGERRPNGGRAADARRPNGGQTADARRPNGGLSGQGRAGQGRSGLSSSAGVARVRDGDAGPIVPPALDAALRRALGRELNDADRRAADRWRADGIPPSVAAQIIGDRADGAQDRIRVARWFDVPVREAAKPFRPEPVDEERERLRSQIEDGALDADQRAELLDRLDSATDADLLSEVEASLHEQMEPTEEVAHA